MRVLQVMPKEDLHLQVVRNKGKKKKKESYEIDKIMQLLR